MSKLAQVSVKDLPPYINFIEYKNVSRETSEQIKQRLIDKVNKYNGGNK